MTLVAQGDITLCISQDGIVFISGTPPSNGTQLLVNKWYHIALVYDNDLLKQQIYVNGNLDSTSTISFDSINEQFYIGAQHGEYDPTDYFNGEIDHLSITTRMKSACEILRDASLVGSYTFSSTSNLGSDSGSYGVTAQLSGSESEDPTTGVIGGALSFDGNSCFFQVFIS